MKKRVAPNDSQADWNLSFVPVLRYNIIFCILIILVIAVGGGVLALHEMQEEVTDSLVAARQQIEYRVVQSITLLESLAAQPEFYDPSLDPYDKAVRLDEIGPQFGYYLVCYVDADINVHSSDSEPASLASRDYMQRLFSTGERQVTDSFAAGADGVTLNYTVAVPLRDPSGNIVGCIFSAIYFDELIELLEQVTHKGFLDAVLIGSRGQIMSSTASLAYGDSITDEIKKYFLIGTSSSRIEANLLNRVPGTFWALRGGDLHYFAYTRIDNTQWDIICSASFWQAYGTILPVVLLVMITGTALSILMHCLMRQYTKSQTAIVNMLVQSIQELEKKIYQDEHSDNHDFKEILRLTSKGLSDGLTGVVTRSVFLNQLEGQFKKLTEEKIAALCFVDLDDLKKLNDTYGHGTGDIALKCVGYVLREYEKKYDGLLGRYDGDEFLLLLTSLDDENELREILDELVLRLNTSINDAAAGEIPIHCSIGVSILHDRHDDIEKVIAEADEALYFIKQSGKGYYKIFQD